MARCSPSPTGEGLGGEGEPPAPLPRERGLGGEVFFRRAKHPGLKRLYLGSLAGFVERRSPEVTNLLEALLADADVTVRHAAVGLAARLHSSPRLQSVLQARLLLEPDADLRAALRRTLSGN